MVSYFKKEEIPKDPMDLAKKAMDYAPSYHEIKNVVDIRKCLEEGKTIEDKLADATPPR